MIMRMSWVRLAIGLVTLSLVAGACQSNVTAPPRQSAANAVATRTMNGAAGDMPAFYDGELFTVNMKAQPVSAAAALIAHNGSINQIYASNDLEDPQEFIPVLDAIQGDGFNPMWRRNLIVFNPGFTPHQFHSDTEVLAAAAGPNPEITIVTTDEMYRCSVVGPK